MNLLDELQLKTGETFYGIVDFVTAKHVYFFDFTRTDQPDYILLAALWKMENSETRFSIWSLLEFPEVLLPRVILVPKSNIRYSSASTKKTPLVANRKIA